MTNIVTKTEVKTILNISGANQDALIDFHIESAQTLLYQILDVVDILTATITKEIVDVFKSEYFYVSTFPATAITGIYDSDNHVELTGYDFLFDVKNQRKVWIVDSNNIPKYLNRSKIKVTYVAGYENANAVPNALKMIVAFMIGGLIAENKTIGGVKEYQVGSKRVKFQDQYQAGMAISMIKTYLTNYYNHCVST